MRRELDGTAAVIFDLDGVVTRTTRVHARAWKETFDPLLARAGQAQFDTASDCLQHVDGKPREDGATLVVRDLGELEAAA